MKKIVRNILISGTAIGIGAALIKLNKFGKAVYKDDIEIRKNFYQVGEEKNKRNYITLYEVNKSKIEKISEELEDVKEKKKTM